MFLLGGTGEGGGAGMGDGGMKGERETTICRLCSDGSSHARSIPDGRTDLRGFGCDCATAKPRKIEPGLTRVPHTFPLTPSFIRLSDSLVVPIDCTHSHGLTGGLYNAMRFFYELISIF